MTDIEELQNRLIERTAAYEKKDAEQVKEILRLKDIIRGYERMASKGVWVADEKYSDMVSKIKHS